MSAPPRPYIALEPGEPAPWFHQRSGDHPHFAFDGVAGRYLVLCFFASSSDPLGERALKFVKTHRALFDGETFSFLGITMDRRDDSEKRVKTKLPGIRYLFDFDGSAGKLYGAMPSDLKPNEGDVLMRRFWVVVSPSLRVMRIFSFDANGGEQPALFKYLKSLPPPDRAEGFVRDAPVLMLDNVFAPDFCHDLVTRYQTKGQGGSHLIEDDVTIRHIQTHIERRILPEAIKAFQFRATRMENNVVSARSEEDAPLPPQRDNTSRATAHRRFSVVIALNAGYDGGELWFPEYGPRIYRPAVGGACVYSSSLLHAQTPLKHGTRYTFVPFLHDDEAAKLRTENSKAV